MSAHDEQQQQQSHQSAAARDSSVSSPTNEDRDLVPELPSTPGLATTYTHNSSLHNLHQQHSPHPPPSSYPSSPVVNNSSGYAGPTSYTGPALQRTTSHVSSVDVGFFDPDGVDQLRRTMSRVSTRLSAERERGTHPPHPSPGSPESVGSTNETVVMDEKFDFAKVLGEFMRK